MCLLGQLFHPGSSPYAKLTVRVPREDFTSADDSLGAIWISIKAERMI